MLAAGGCYALGRAQVPTFTNPNNVAIVTGVSAARNGIAGNHYRTASGEEVQVTEQVKLSFAQYKLTYKLQDDLGQGTTSPTFGYNIQKMIAA